MELLRIRGLPSSCTKRSKISALPLIGPRRSPCVLAPASPGGYSLTKSKMEDSSFTARPRTTWNPSDRTFDWRQCGWHRAPSLKLRGCLMTHRGARLLAARIVLALRRLLYRHVCGIVLIDVCCSCRQSQLTRYGYTVTSNRSARPKLLVRSNAGGWRCRPASVKTLAESG